MQCEKFFQDNNCYRNVVFCNTLEILSFCWISTRSDFNVDSDHSQWRATNPRNQSSASDEWINAITRSFIVGGFRCAHTSRQLRIAHAQMRRTPLSGLLRENCADLPTMQLHVVQPFRIHHKNARIDKYCMQIAIFAIVDLFHCTCISCSRNEKSCERVKCLELNQFIASILPMKSAQSRYFCMRPEY